MLPPSRRQPLTPLPQVARVLRPALARCPCVPPPKHAQGKQKHSRRRSSQSKESTPTHADERRRSSSQSKESTPAAEGRASPSAPPPKEACRCSKVAHARVLVEDDVLGLQARADTAEPPNNAAVMQRAGSPPPPLLLRSAGKRPPEQGAPGGAQGPGPSKAAKHAPPDLCGPPPGEPPLSPPPDLPGCASHTRAAPRLRPG